MKINIKARHIVIVATAILMVAVFIGVFQIMNTQRATPNVVATLENVRDYAPATTADGTNYAVDGGLLFAGEPLNWEEIETPEGIIVGAVAFANASDAGSGESQDILYIGAANEMAIYRSDNLGKNWLRVPLTDEYIGGVTDIAVDSLQRLVYVGTDNGGVFRLRDVGSSMINSSQLLLDQPVRQVVADSTGAGLAFARTDWNLYRAENFGLSWVTVDNLMSSPTAVAIANTTPATAYVGTADRGVLSSQDGKTWTLENEGLGLVPGSRLYVNTLTVDPARPEVLYVATSFLYGSAELHSTPRKIAMSTDGATAWTTLIDGLETGIAELLPVSGRPGALYALTSTSRTPAAIGSAPVVAAGEETVATTGAVNASASIGWTGILAWIVAGLAMIALAYAAMVDMRARRPATSPEQSVEGNELAPERIRYHG